MSGSINRDTEKLDHLSELGISPDRVRLDANNLWESAIDALDHLQPLADRFAAIEEPLHSKDIGQLRQLSGELERPVILDESFLRLAQFGEIDSDPGQFWFNVRVSKMGVLIRSLDVIDRAEEVGITVIVGAQVGETSLLTRGGMTVAQHARRVLRGQEGAFGTHLLQADVVDPPLMFGHGGCISIDEHLQCVRPRDFIRPEAFLSLISKA